MALPSHFFHPILLEGLWAQSAPPATDDATQLRQEIDQLKKTVNALEQRLDAQQKTAQTTATQPAEKKEEAGSTAELQSKLCGLARDALTGLHTSPDTVLGYNSHRVGTYP